MKKLLFNTLLSLCSIYSIHAQDVSFTFANAQNTNGGNSYEVDVMISSVSGFKLGSGQLYFNYNTAAFGTNVVANSKVTITRPVSSVLGTLVGTPPFQFDFYNNFVENDNNTSRFSFSWQHAFSEACLSGNNITNSAVVLFHLKIDYTGGGAGQSPDLCFESSSGFDNQTFTACGPATCTNADCGSNPGSQITNDSYNCAGASLPVELLFFSAELEAPDKIVLNWETASEMNTSHFEIERSIDGRTWDYWNTVLAKGEGYNLSNYEMCDNELPKNLLSNIIYYRLKMVDWDGFFEYSDIRNVAFKRNSMKIQVYPNPTQRDLFISFSEQKDIEEGQIILMDFQGKQLLHRRFFTLSELIHLQFTELQLAEGIYALSVFADGQQVLQERIVIMD